MPTYLKPTEIDTLHLPSDSAFEVHIKRPTFGDQLAAQSATLDAANPGAAYVNALLRLLIVEWNLTDESGEPLPITEANINNLKPIDGEFLVSESKKRGSAQRSVANG